MAVSVRSGLGTAMVTAEPAHGLGKPPAACHHASELR